MIFNRCYQIHIRQIHIRQIHIRRIHIRPNRKGDLMGGINMVAQVMINVCHRKTGEFIFNQMETNIVRQIFHLLA